MNKLHLKKLGLILCMAAMPWLAHAASLGKLSVFSALGEPLNAEIELLEVTPEESSSLSANLASDEQYAAQGIDKAAAQRNINTSISKKPDGTMVIQLTSSQALTEPFLDMVIQVAWSTGQLSREYTLLLDPAESSTANVAAPVVDAPKAIANQSAVQDAASITTAKGDTLSAIVNRIQVQDVNLDQLLVGVYEANKSAFVGGNMNRLKVGQVLNIPRAEVLQAINKDEAKTEIRAQVSSWHAYSARIADAVSRSESTDSGASNQNSGKIVTKAEDKAEPVAEEPRDVVKLAKTEKDSERSVANLQDDLAAKENAIKETDEKSAALEKQIADMKKLLVVKNKSMADVQKNAVESTQKSTHAPSILDGLNLRVLSVIAAVLAGLIALWLWLRPKNEVQLTFENNLRWNTQLFSNAQASSNAQSSSSQPNSGSLKDAGAVAVDNDQVAASLDDTQDAPAPAKALEVNLADIHLSFDTVPQFDAPASAAPIPDAFNGDFSNLLKVEAKPKAPKSAPVKPAPSKSAASKSVKPATKKKSEGNLTESPSVATKLELAAAYIDMADKRGARKLLNEALDEGGPEQRARAQSLIDSLA